MYNIASQEWGSKQNVEFLRNTRYFCMHAQNSCAQWYNGLHTSVRAWSDDDASVMMHWSLPMHQLFLRFGHRVNGLHFDARLVESSRYFLGKVLDDYHSQVVTNRALRDEMVASFATIRRQHRQQCKHEHRWPNG